nr:hypothetical protein [Candidatus Desulfatibia vada]
TIWLVPTSRPTCEAGLPADTDAFQLIPRLEKVNPKLKIVAMTGYDTAELEKEIRKLGVLHYIRKPFTSNELKTLLMHVQEFFHLIG